METPPLPEEDRGAQALVGSSPPSMQTSSHAALNHEWLDFDNECGGSFHPASTQEFALMEPSIKRQRLEAAAELSMPSTSYSSFTSLEDGEIIDSEMDHPFDTHETAGSFSYEDMFAYDDDEEEPELKIIQEDSNSYGYGDEGDENDDEEADTTLVDPDSFLQIKTENHLSVEDIQQEDYESLNGMQSSSSIDAQQLFGIHNEPDRSRRSSHSEAAAAENTPANSCPLEAGSKAKVAAAASSDTTNSREKTSEDDYDDEDEDEEEEDFELDADELDSMLEEGMHDYGTQKRDGKKKAGDGEKSAGGSLPYAPPLEKQKVVLVERGHDPFDILPEGWVVVTHNSGMPVYLHKASRVCTLSRPYFLGPGSARKHDIPGSAIPCYQYRKALEKEKKSQGCPQLNSPLNASSPAKSQDASSDAEATNAGASDLPDGAPTDNQSQAAISKSSQSEPAKSSAEETARGSKLAGPTVKVESAEAMKKENNLDPEQMRIYCAKLFEFKTITVKRFRTWKDRRNHNVMLKKASRPALPSDTKLITFPMQPDKDSSLPNRKKEFVFNPAGKTEVCILHEYVQHALRVQPKYVFKELENGKTPYSATVVINGVQYGSGYASSKKAAKMEAAKASLKILIPDLNVDGKASNAPETVTAGNEEGASVAKETKKLSGGASLVDGTATVATVPDTIGSSDLSFFDEIKVEDPRVTELSFKAGQPSPFQVLGDCLKRNYGLGDTDIHVEMKALKHQRSEFIMRVGKHEARVMCKNKREGKHRASQNILQKLHPHIQSWGSLLRLYNWKEVFREKKAEKQTVSELQAGHHPNKAILGKLKQEMHKLFHRQKDGQRLVDGRPQFLPKDVKTAELMSIDL